MVTVTCSRVTEAELADLKYACRLFGITQDRIARTADVTRTHVVNVFAGRNTNANVIRVARRLLARAQRQGKRAAS